VAHTIFASAPLPPSLAGALRARLAASHAQRPFSPLDAREAARRCAAILTDLGVRAVVYRGGLDLRGAEIDHLWVAVDGAVVLDAAFPLHSPAFVEVLRRFVAGDAEPQELDAAAPDGLDARVLGVIPTPMSYRGAPVWSARAA